MVAGAGFEPTTFGLWARRATRLLHPAILFNFLLSRYLIGLARLDNFYLASTEANGAAPPRDIIAYNSLLNAEK